MGIFNTLFGGSGHSKELKTIPWIALNDLMQLDTIKRHSINKTQVIFKHSTRCGISSMVMRQFVDNYKLTDKDIDLHYLDLLRYRPISDAIADAFNIRHESPQLLVVKNGVVVSHASHGDINALDLYQFV